MYPAIYARISHRTNKQPKRIKVFSNAAPVYYLYQDKLEAYENYALACQNFCNLNDIEGRFYAAVDKDGLVFVKINEFCYVDKETNFDKEEKIL